MKQDFQTALQCVVRILLALHAFGVRCTFITDVWANRLDSLDPVANPRTFLDDGARARCCVVIGSPAAVLVTLDNGAPRRHNRRILV